MTHRARDEEAVSVREASEQRIGRTVCKHYRIERFLGAGGMGSLYVATDSKLKRVVAVKFLQGSLGPDAVRRFKQEAMAAAQLSSPHVVPVYDFDDGADPCIIMELLVGRDCRKLIHESGRLSEARAAHIVHQACLGMSVAHEQGILHRDIKPENIFCVRYHNDPDFVKLLDFGIAKLCEPDGASATESGAILGTVHYLSPERVKDQGADERGDIWALGAVLYELLLARRAFDGDGRLEIMNAIVNEPVPALDELRRVAPGLCPVVERALAKDPGQRFASVDQMARALKPFVRAAPPADATSAAPTQRSIVTPLPKHEVTPGGTAQAPRAAQPWQPNDRQRRSRVLLATGAGTVLAVGGVVVGITLFREQRSSPTLAVSASALQPSSVTPTAVLSAEPSSRVTAAEVASADKQQPASSGSAAQGAPSAKPQVRKRSLGERSGTKRAEAPLDFDEANPYPP